MVFASVLRVHKNKVFGEVYRQLLFNILCKLAQSYCTPKTLLPLVSVDVIFCYNCVKYKANIAILLLL